MRATENKQRATSGSRLAGTSLTFEQLRQQIRSPRDQMPRFSEANVSDQDIRNLYAFERSLGP